MSFDIFISAYHDGEAGLMDRKIVERAFASLVADPSAPAGHWKLVLPPAATPCFAEVYMDDGAQIPDFSVSRPPFDPSFWDAIYEVLRQTTSILFWPGPDEQCMCVGNPDAIAHLDPDIEAMGPIPIFSSGGEIGDYVEENC